MGDLPAAESGIYCDQVNRLQPLLEQLRAVEDPISALCSSVQDIASLMDCDGAAVIVNGHVHPLEPAQKAWLLPLAEKLQTISATQAGQIPVFQLTLEMEADISHSVLAMRFNRSEGGWLLWLRHGTGAHWSADDLDTAGLLRTELLEILLEQAQGMSTLQRRLISSIGHGLCNPLQSISMSAALLKAQDQRSVELRSHISLASESMERQIRQMLEINRLHGGERLRINPVEGNLSNLVASEASRLRNAAPDLDMQASIEPDILARFDPERLTQAIRHLLNNAQQNATADTPVRLRLERDTKAADVLLTVSNHTPELAHHRFNSLFNAVKPDATTAPRGNRLGVGLFVTANIVRAHDGRISAHQQDGVIEFRLRLPAVAAA